MQLATVLWGLPEEGDSFDSLSAHDGGKLGLGENLDSRPARSLGGTGSAALRVRVNGVDQKLIHISMQAINR